MESKTDYRSMTDEQLRCELKKLEKEILRRTGDPLADGGGHSKWWRWRRNRTAVDRVEEMMVHRSYLLHHLFEKHCTPAEVARLEKVNALLLDLTNRTYKRTARLARAALSMPREALDDDFMVEGKLVAEFDLPGSVLRLEDDTYYGSDFVRMAAILQETEESKPTMVFASPSVNLFDMKHDSPAMTDEQLGCANDLDDGDTWAEAWLDIPPLKHITVCYAMHALVTHMSWSIPDVLRINDYKMELTLTVQQFSDQERNRLWWWRKCDLPRFKEVFLKEAESRDPDIPLERFIFQRSRDRFEDQADEALAEAGMENIDRYLEALCRLVRK